MKIVKTFAAISGDPPSAGSIVQFDTIEHGGQWWIVPAWLAPNKEGLSQPLRLIRLALLPHSPFGENFALASPIPKAVLDGKAKGIVEEALYEVVEQPDIRLRVPGHLN